MANGNGNGNYTLIFIIIAVIILIWLIFCISKKENYGFGMDYNRPWPTAEYARYYNIQTGPVPLDELDPLNYYPH